jgi:hypothetical protein
MTDDFSFTQSTYVPTLQTTDKVVESSIFINQVLYRLGIQQHFLAETDDNKTLNERIFMNVLDFVGSLEFYTIFSKRTFLSCQEFMFSHPEITSFIMDANMLLRGYMSVKPLYGESVIDLINGFVSSLSFNIVKDKKYFPVSFKNYESIDVFNLTDVDASDTTEFLKQIIDNPSTAVNRALGTWQIVFILISYHFSDILTYINDTKN